MPRSGGRFADDARFFKSWFENPLRIGALAPSGPVLAEAMAQAVDPRVPGPVIELGPGTGAITQALLGRGIAPSRLILVEFDAAFCSLLGERFPGVRIVRGDAYALAPTLRGHLEAPAAATVSGLPLLLKPEPMRAALIAEAFGLMRADGIFVQFTYGLASPVPRSPVSFEAEGLPRVWRNFPPARVWIYRRAGSQGAGCAFGTVFLAEPGAGLAKTRDLKAESE